MRTMQRQERTPVTTPAMSPAPQGRTAGRPDADRSSTNTSTTMSSRRVAGLVVVVVLLLGGLFGYAVPALTGGDSPAPVAPVHEQIRDEHANRIPMGPTTPAEPDTPVAPPTAPYRGSSDQYPV